MIPFKAVWAHRSTGHLRIMEVYAEDLDRAAPGFDRIRDAAAGSAHSFADYVEVWRGPADMLPLPETRRFRNCWRWKLGRIHRDLTKATAEDLEMSREAIVMERVLRLQQDKQTRQEMRDQCDRLRRDLATMNAADLENYSHDKANR